MKPVPPVTSTSFGGMLAAGRAWVRFWILTAVVEMGL